MRKKPKTSTRYLSINPIDPEPDVVSEAVRVIEQGGVVVFPTRCLYGLAADARDEQAVRRVYDIKRRPLKRPLLVLTKSRQAALRLVENPSRAAICLMEQFWPGNLTIVLRAGPSIPAALTGGTGRIGIRVPAQPVAAAMVNAMEGPVTGTSANISGAGGCSAISALAPAVAEGSDLVLDAGPLLPGNGSTVVDAVSGAVLLLREGVVPQAVIESVLEKRALKMIDNSD